MYLRGRGRIGSSYATQNQPKRNSSHSRQGVNSNRLSQCSDQSLEIAAARVAMSRSTLEHFYSHDDIGNRESAYSDYSANSSTYLSSHIRKSSRATEYDNIHESTIIEANNLLKAAKAQAREDISRHLLSDKNNINIQPIAAHITQTTSYVADSGQGFPPIIFDRSGVEHRQEQVLRHEYIHIPMTLRNKQARFNSVEKNICPKSTDTRRESLVASNKSKQKRRENYVYETALNGKGSLADESCSYTQLQLDKQRKSTREFLEKELNKIEILRKDIIQENEKELNNQLHILETQNKFVQSWEYPGDKNVGILLNLQETQECLSISKRESIGQLENSYNRELEELQNHLQDETLKLDYLLKTNQQRLEDYFVEATEIQILRDGYHKENLRNKNQLKDLKIKYQSMRESLQLSEYTSSENSLRYQLDECTLLKTDMNKRKNAVAELEGKVEQCDQELQETNIHINKLEKQVQEEKDILEKIMKEFDIKNAVFVTKPISNYPVRGSPEILPYIDDESKNDIDKIVPHLVESQNDSHIQTKFLDRFLLGKSAAIRYQKYKMSIRKENVGKSNRPKDNEQKTNIAISAPIIPRIMENNAGSVPMRLIPLSEAKKLHGYGAQTPPSNTLRKGQWPDGTYRAESAKRESYFQEIF
ncbi:uncharacterized protein RNJ42_00628 [Nakaseomyces bracarensis]|uniref:uncharacterized protein n=1 Tax=Nakaseomyces bracarensis TaxID=273131 RepID=UPI00387124DF